MSIFWKNIFAYIRHHRYELFSYKMNFWCAICKMLISETTDRSYLRVCLTNSYLWSLISTIFISVVTNMSMLISVVTDIGMLISVVTDIIECYIYGNWYERMLYLRSQIWVTHISGHWYERLSYLWCLISSIVITVVTDMSDCLSVVSKVSFFWKKSSYNQDVNTNLLFVWEIVGGFGRRDQIICK